MENATKALLIAAAVLVAIILIALGVKIFSSSKDTSSQAQTIGQTIADAAKSASSTLSSSLGKANGGNLGGGTSTGPNGGEVLTGEQLKQDIINNRAEYLKEDGTVQKTGQNINSNKDIGIGTDGNIINLDLWGYKVVNNTIAIVGEGSNGGAYKGTNENPIMPQYILMKDYPNGFLTVKYLGDPNDGYSEPFVWNTTINQVIIPNTVTSLLWYSFRGCTSLVSITIPNSVTAIGTGSFWECANLTEIIVDNKEGAISGAPWGAPSTTKIKYLR